MTPTPAFRKRTACAAALLLALALLALFGLAELAARRLEPAYGTQGAIEYDVHPELGWLPRPGRMRYRTSEFAVDNEVNSQGMNDDPLGDPSRVARRIAALGDSHTFALGVSQREAWPNRLEQLLFDDPTQGAVYNLGVVGYSLGQYLLRYRQLADAIRPEPLIVGFSMATDLYDLIPPERGGFIYGAEKGRIYFDLDPQGKLVEQRELAGKTLAATTTAGSLRLRAVFEQVALFRRFKRSGLGLWVAMRFRPGGNSLWPGMDTALKRELDAGDAYRWQLAEEILSELAREARRDGVRAVALVNIPYLAQVYDDVWESSFGSDAGRYDRSLPGQRLQAICRRAGIHYVDATPAFVEEARHRGDWLHFRQDGHPNPEGQALIARVLAGALATPGLLE